MAKPKEKESSVDIVEESKNDVFNLPFDQAFPATEELQSDNLTLEDAHVAPRRVQGQVIETLICIEPPDDVIADIQAAHAGLEFVDEFKIILGRCSGSAYDVGAALNGQLDVDSTASFNSDGYLADGSAHESPMYYHAMVINDAPVLAEQIGEALEVAGIEVGAHDFAPRMMVGMAPAAVEAPHFTYSFPIDEVIVDDGVSRVPVRIKSSAAKMKPAEGENAQSDKEAAGWNLAELTTPGITSDSMEDIGQRFTNPNVFEDPRGRMAQTSTTTTGLSPRGNKVVAIKNGNDKYIYNLAIPGQRLMVLGGSMPRLAPATVSVDSLYDQHADTLSNEDAMLGDHLADLVAGKKTGDVEEPYSQGDGPMGVRFEEDKEYNIVKGAQLKELQRKPTTLDIDDKELEVGRQDYFLPDSTPDRIEEVDYELPEPHPFSDSYQPPDEMYNVREYHVYKGIAYRKSLTEVGQDWMLYRLEPGYIGDVPIAYIHVARNLSIGSGFNRFKSKYLPTAHLFDSNPIPESAAIWGFKALESVDPTVEKFIDDVPELMDVPSGAYELDGNTWARLPEANDARMIDHQRLAQVDWENVTSEQLALRNKFKTLAKPPMQSPARLTDSSDTYSDLPSERQVELDQMSELIPGSSPRLVKDESPRKHFKGPHLNPQHLESLQPVRMHNGIYVNEVEEFVYRLENADGETRYIEFGVDPVLGKPALSWGGSPMAWVEPSQEVLPLSDPWIEQVLDQLGDTIFQVPRGTAFPNEKSIWTPKQYEDGNPDPTFTFPNYLASSDARTSVAETIKEDEIEKDAVGLIEGPVVNEDHGDDFSRADQAIPRPRGMDKFIHRK